MGVQRIPLRLPRAAPVPLCPGSSSSTSPCRPLAPTPYTPHLRKAKDRASLLRLRNQAQKKPKSALNPSPGATLQHCLNRPTVVEQKIFISGLRAGLAIFHGACMDSALAHPPFARETSAVGVNRVDSTLTYPRNYLVLKPTNATRMLQYYSK